jgi:hypothetical protein
MVQSQECVYRNKGIPVSEGRKVLFRPALLLFSKGSYGRLPVGNLNERGYVLVEEEEQS